MPTEPKQSFWTNTFAAVTALATLAGAVGGLVATAVAITDGGDATSTMTPAPPSASTVPKAQSASPTFAVEVRTPSPTPGVVTLGAGVDSWWPSPAGRPGDYEDQEPAETETLILDWGCSDDSRGNGSKEECGSGLIVIRFDLRVLPDGVTIDEAVLALEAKDVSDEDINVYARNAAWTEESAEPQCEARGEVRGESDRDHWTWDVTALYSEGTAGEENAFTLCLIHKENAYAAFHSVEGDHSRTPTLTLSYH